MRLGDTVHLAAAPGATEGRVTKLLEGTRVHVYWLRHPRCARRTTGAPR